jgi:glucokinase
MLLAGDIGGTKTVLAIFSLEADLHAPVAEATLPSRRYASLEALVHDFLKDKAELPIEQAVFGVAGPVVEGRAEVTNLPWLLEEGALRKALNVSSVHLLNDLQSIASAVPFLHAEDVHTLHPGKPVPHTPIAVVAPGTGLGEAFLTWDGIHYLAHPSEGGHTSFAPTDDEQVEMLRFLSGRFDHVSYERVCSGLGIPNIYAFYKETGRYQEPAWLSEAISATDDITPILVQNALSRPDECEICVKTVEMFVTVLGAEASNLALTVLSTAGVYLGGGIPPRILPALSNGRFMKAFLDKGRFSQLLKNVPVHVILNPKVALMGAASYGLVLAEQKG